MRLRDVVTSAAANTFRSKLRTTLTVLALFVGAFTLTLTNAVGAGVTDYVTTQVSTLSSDDVFLVAHEADATAPAEDGPAEYDPETSAAQSGGAGGQSLPGFSASEPITESDLDTIGDLDGVVSVEPVRLVSTNFVTTDGSRRYELGINPTSAVTRSNLLAGDQLDEDADDPQLVLPSSYVESLGFDSADDAIGKAVELGLTDVLGAPQTVDAEIVGVSRESLLVSGAGANDTLLTDLAESQAAGVVNGSERYSIAIARFDGELSTDDVDALRDDLSAEGYSAQTVEDQLGIIQTVLSGITGVLNAFAIVALIAAAFGIVNTLLMSVQERTREIGLMKAMGMSGGKIFALFSAEAVFIGLLGSAIGALAAVLLGSLVNGVLGAGPLADLDGLTLLLFDPLSVGGVFLLIMLIAFLSGTLPAQRAARQRPIESLRYE